MDIVFILISVVYTIVNTGKIFSSGMPYFLLVEFILFVLAILLRRKRQLLSVTAYTMLHMVLIFLTIFITYQQMVSGRVLIGGQVNRTEHMWRVFTALIMGLIAGVISFVFFQYAGQKVKRVFGVLAIIASILLLLAVRVIGNPVPNTNVYLTIGPIMAIGPIVIAQPFIASFCLTNGWLNKKTIRDTKLSKWVFFEFIKEITLGKCLFVVVNIIIVGLFVICKDLGSCLIIIVSSGFMLLPSFKENKAKIALIGIGIIGVVLMLFINPTFQSRLIQSFFTSEIVSGEYDLTGFSEVRMESMKAVAKQILDVQVQFFQQGWYGSGYNAKYIANISEDYVIYGIVYDFGTLFFIAFIVFVGCFVYYLVKYMGMSDKLEDNAMARMGIYLIVVPMVYIICSNLGILPLTGICFPYMSSGRWLFMAYGFITGMLVSIQQNNEYLLG